MNFEAIVNELCEKAHERGYSWAHARAATNMSDADREFLENDALTLTSHLQAPPFDPKSNPEDQLVQEVFEQQARDLDDAEMALAFAHADIKIHEQQLADHTLADQPHTSTLGTACGTALFATGFAIGLYDWIHDRLADPYLSGIAALAPSIALGLFVTTSIYSADSPRKRTWGVIAGLALSISAGLLRYALSGGGAFIALSLTLFEVAIVAVLDWRGRHLTDEFAKWSEDQKEHARRQQHLDAAEQAGKRASDRVRELAEQTAAHRKMVLSRSICSQKFPEIGQAVKKAEVAGAQRGIAVNQGLKRGVVRFKFTPKTVTK